MAGRCEVTTTLYDPAALTSRTPKTDSVKATIQCTLPAGHGTYHAATIADSEPQATVVWEKED